MTYKVYFDRTIPSRHINHSKLTNTVYFYELINDIPHANIVKYRLIISVFS